MSAVPLSTLSSTSTFDTATATAATAWGFQLYRSAQDYSLSHVFAQLLVRHLTQGQQVWTHVSFVLCLPTCTCCSNCAASVLATWIQDSLCFTIEPLCQYQEKVIATIQSTCGLLSDEQTGSVGETYRRDPLEWHLEQNLRRPDQTTGDQAMQSAKSPRNANNSPQNLHCLEQLRLTMKDTKTGKDQCAKTKLKQVQKLKFIPQYISIY